MKFVRYGSLEPQHHKIEPEENGKMWFHTPPVETGIYAFPKGFVEPFILSGMGAGSLQNGRYRKLKDASGKPITGKKDDFMQKSEDGYYWEREWTSQWKTWFRKNKIREKDVSLMSEKGIGDTHAEDDDEVFLVVQNRPREFEYSGNVWSHLDSIAILNQKDGKFKKDKTLIDPANIIARSGSWVLTDMKTYESALKKYIKMQQYLSTIWERYSNRGNFPISYYSKDALEVYIESVQK